MKLVDGRTGQRRFMTRADMGAVFDWTDAVFGIEREEVVLSMVGGSRKSFGYKEVVGDGLTALGVTERIVEGWKITRSYEIVYNHIISINNFD